MKIKVKDLEANPFRKMKEYPIDREKIKALKSSIKEKTFWDNILVRPHPSNMKKYQIAYGHHRWIALKELNIKEIDVPVRALDDALMLQIMAEENLNWSTNTAITTQTILTTKEFIDAKLAKYEYKDSPKNMRVLFESKHAYNQTKNKKDGCGEPTILKFLGGNWKGWMIETALRILKDKDLDQKAATSIPTMEQAKVFRSSVKEYKIPKPTQKKIAKKIIKEGVGKRDIPDLVAKHSIIPVKKEKSKPKALPMLDDFIKDMINRISDLHGDFIKVKGHLNQIQSPNVKKEFRNISEELLTEMKLVLKEN